jgi:hypothetical protein
MRHSRAFTMNSKGVVERPHRQKRSLGATIQRSAHRAFAEVRRTSGMCHKRLSPAAGLPKSACLGRGGICRPGVSPGAAPRACRSVWRRCGTSLCAFVTASTASSRRVCHLGNTDCS